MSVVICGIPKWVNGQYYCPYCYFSSFNIEDFAVGMCWYCVYVEENNKEEEMASSTGKITDSSGKILDLSEVKVGDTVVLTHEGVVGSIDSYEGYLHLKATPAGYGGGRKVRVSGGQYGYYKGYPMYDVKVVKAATTTPANWPPKAGDVWVANGKDYHTVWTGYDVFKHYPGDNYNYSTVDNAALLKMNPVLKLRNGTAVK